MLRRENARKFHTAAYKRHQVTSTNNGILGEVSLSRDNGPVTGTDISRNRNALLRQEAGSLQRRFLQSRETDQRCRLCHNVECVHIFVFFTFKYIQIIITKNISLSVELEQMFNEDGLVLNEVIEGEIKRPFGSYNEKMKNGLWGHSGSGSGGYADFIFRYAARNLFDEEDVTVNFKPLRNTDFQEVELKRNDEVLLKFAVINGFKNIQNIVQKMKRNKCVYDYVEIMACPCGN